MQDQRILITTTAATMTTSPKSRVVQSWSENPGPPPSLLVSQFQDKFKNTRVIHMSKNEYCSALLFQLRVCEKCANGYGHSGKSISYSGPYSRVWKTLS